MDPNVEKMTFHELPTYLGMFWIRFLRHDDRSVKNCDLAIQDDKTGQKHEKTLNFTFLHYVLILSCF